jgi:hypothetical protein
MQARNLKFCFANKNWRGIIPDRAASGGFVLCTHLVGKPLPLATNDF